MSAAGTSPGLAICIQSGAFDRVHYALVLAAAAAAVNRPVTLFFTLWACRALTRGADGAPGWAAMPVSEGGLDAAGFDARLGERRVARMEELLEGCVALGVRFLACESGLVAAGLARADLRDDVPIEVTGAVSFLAAIPPGSVTFFV